MSCTRCKLHTTRVKQVLPHGPTPCDILVVDESPSSGDDVLGRCWTGKHYKLFDAALESAWTLSDNILHTPRYPSYSVVYVVQCKPCDSLGGKRREPLPQEIELCSSNLLDAYSRRRPALVLFAGSQVAQMCRGRFACRTLTIPHPEYVQRRGGRAAAEFKQLRTLLETAIEIVTQERRTV